MEAQQERRTLLGNIHNVVKAIEPWGILLAVIALLLTVVQFWADFRDRVSEREVRAWQLLTTPAPGNSGKKAALEYLNDEDGLFCFEWLVGTLSWFKQNDPPTSKCLVTLKHRTPLIGINLPRKRVSWPAPISAATTQDPTQLPTDTRREPSLSYDDIQFQEPGVFLRGLVLREATLTQSDLRGAELDGADLTDTELNETILLNARLPDAILQRANLTDAILIRAVLERADLSEAVLVDAVLERTNLIDAKLINANLRNAHLAQVIAIRTNLKGADLTEANLYGAIFEDANLTHAIFSKAHFLRAYLVGANLSGADLSTAIDLSQNQLDRACGNSDTKLPPGLSVPNCQ